MKEDNYDIIHTTGAFLRPQKHTDMLGNVIWNWVVVEFTDDSYKDGEVYNPVESAYSNAELIKYDFGC
ncbi:MAG: hypothetical protein LBR34_07950 [Prevotella sp.]|jgi:hypothetical protein|nr:hypothetical protein [Prevotella sp.]